MAAPIPTASTARTPRARSNAVAPAASTPSRSTSSVPTAWLGPSTRARTMPGWAIIEPRSAESGVPVRIHGFHSGR